MHARDRLAPAPDVADARAEAVTPRAPARMPSHLTPEMVLRLQASAGNAAVARLVEPERESPATPEGAAPQVTVQRSLWDDITGAVSDAASAVGGAVSDAASAVGGAVSSAASAVGGAVSDAASAVGGAVSSAWDAVSGGAAAALSAITGIASDVLAGAARLGGRVLDWVGSAGSSVWNAISAIGSRAWPIIAAIGTVLFEKLALMGDMAWSFVSHIPERLMRLVVDGWEGIVGVVGWLGSGLRGAVGAGWEALVGVFSWLEDGLEGALHWLAGGLASGVAWIVDFLSAPSLDKLRDGLLGTLTWVWDGIQGLGQFGWNGLVAAAKWAGTQLRAFGQWLWDGAIAGLTWAGEVLIHLLELVGAGEALQLLWGLIFRLRPLTAGEEGASASVHPAGLIPYPQIRVDEDSYLIKIGQKLASVFGTAVSPGAITTMHVIHAPAGAMTPALAVHELTHVAQYELVGAVYMPQALHGQNTAAGYDYGDLTTARAGGQHFSDFNREQQASICEDYYKVRNGARPDYGATEAELDPFIAEMRALQF